jgi:hypothetical protein
MRKIDIKALWKSITSLTGWQNDEKLIVDDDDGETDGGGILT